MPQINKIHIFVPVDDIICNAHNQIKNTKLTLATKTLLTRGPVMPRDSRNTVDKPYVFPNLFAMP